MELQGRRSRGRVKLRFVDLGEEDMKTVCGVRDRDAEDVRVKWKEMKVTSF